MKAVLIMLLAYVGLHAQETVTYKEYKFILKKENAKVIADKNGAIIVIEYYFTKEQKEKLLSDELLQFLEPNNQTTICIRTISSSNNALLSQSCDDVYLYEEKSKKGKYISTHLSQVMYEPFISTSDITAQINDEAIRINFNYFNTKEESFTKDKYKLFLDLEFTIRTKTK